MKLPIAFEVFPYLSAEAWASLMGRVKEAGGNGVCGLAADGRAIATTNGRAPFLVETTAAERMALTVARNRPAA